MEELSREELLEKIEELQQEIDNLKKRKKKKKRQNIKTSPKEIVDYWKERQDECGLSVDWGEAEERCWRCGYKKNLQRCHIIPDSLGGKDEPANLVLLCERCHIDAPNVESKTFMWDY
jgi:5-methylcytosine-specific restriction endonuclease McrA